MNRSLICDGREINCLDGSDELCGDPCLKNSVRRTVVRKCKEDESVCFPVEQYCNGKLDCPDGSDEADSGCTCQHWKMADCFIQDQNLCVYEEWVLDDRISSLCGNTSKDMSLKKRKILTPGNQPHQSM